MNTKCKSKKKVWKKYRPKYHSQSANKQIITTIKCANESVKKFMNTMKIAANFWARENNLDLKWVARGIWKIVENWQMAILGLVYFCFFLSMWIFICVFVYFNM